MSRTIRLLGVLALTSTAAARDAVVLLGWEELQIEIAGTNGRIRAPVESIPASGWWIPEATPGLTADGDRALYSSGWDIYEASFSSMQPQLYAVSDRFLDDIALLGPKGPGQRLYGVVGCGGSAEIVEIGSDGATTTVCAVSSPVVTPNPYAYRWRLSANSLSKRMVVSATPQDLSNPSVLAVVDPATWTVTHEPAIPAGVTFADTVLRANGLSFVQIPRWPPFDQYVYWAPDWASAGQLSPAARYGATCTTYLGDWGPVFLGRVSDEFGYNYSPEKPAAANVWAENDYRPSIPLFRQRPVSWTLSYEMTNTASPDFTAVDDVVLEGVAWEFFDGPAVPALDMVVQAEPPGPFEPGRQLGQVLFKADADMAVEGGYMCWLDTILSGRYDHGIRRKILTWDGHGGATDRTVCAFAVDPVSENVVGNGDFDESMFLAGWYGDAVYSHYANRMTFILDPDQPRQQTSQIMELPTPDQPMLLSFDYRYEAHGSPESQAQITLTLNDDMVAHVVGIGPSDEFQTFSAILNDPQFRGLEGAELSFIVDSNTGTESYLLLDNVFLGVPEPAALTLLALGACLPLLRRRR